LVIDEAAHRAAVVDVAKRSRSSPPPGARKVELVAILSTHHHL
jgi:hypothetical protein